MKHALIEKVFNTSFATERTLLIGGAAEPLYLPHSANSDAIARIYYRQDFAASALHEVSHWCIAGNERRRLTDFGYCYTPDGRDAKQQDEFFRFEIKPQALESIFAKTANIPFNLSVDNLKSLSVKATDEFAAAVAHQRDAYLSNGLPPRAERFRRALAEASLQ